MKKANKINIIAANADGGLVLLGFSFRARWVISISWQNLCLRLKLTGTMKYYELLILINLTIYKPLGVLQLP